MESVRALEEGAEGQSAEAEDTRASYWKLESWGRAAETTGLDSLRVTSETFRSGDISNHRILMKGPLTAKSLWLTSFVSPIT